MRKLNMKVGDKFNKLTAVKFSHKNNGGQQYWIFKCECGTEKVIQVCGVKNGRVKSCGCLRGENHGMKGTRTHNSWKAMKQRCSNKNVENYKYYGGRGIKVCFCWLNSFENFFRDMGKRPIGKTLDRISCNGNYEPNNCKWSTPKEQVNNRRI